MKNQLLPKSEIGKRTRKEKKKNEYVVEAQAKVTHSHRSP